MRTSTEIKAEIAKSKAMNSCGMGYKAFATGEYMKSLEAELNDALESEANTVEAHGFTAEELENLTANLADLSARLATNATKVNGTKVDLVIFDEMILDEDDYSTTLEDVRYSIDF